jgi:cell division protein FtsL
MAELKKFEELPYEYQHSEEYPQQTEEKQLKLSYQANEQAPLSPLRRLRKVSLLERFIIAFLGIAIISGAVLMIQTRNTVTKTEGEITTMESKITQREDQAKQLVQEKAELSRSERVKKIAEEKGLSVNDGNLRKVK